MAATPFSLEGLLLYMTETYTAGVIQSYQGQGMLENAPLIQRQDPLEDFKKFDQNDEIFQEYDPPLGDDSKMGWKKSRPPKNKCRTWPFIDFNISSLFILIYFLLYFSTFSIFVWDFPTLCQERRYFFLYLFVYESQVFVTWSLLGRERTLGMRPWE